MGNCVSNAEEDKDRRLSAYEASHDNLYSGLIWIQNSEVLGNKYEVIGELGRGGAGEVHLVEPRCSFQGNYDSSAIRKLKIDFLDGAYDISADSKGLARVFGAASAITLPISSRSSGNSTYDDMVGGSKKGINTLINRGSRFSNSFYEDMLDLELPSDEEGLGIGDVDKKDSGKRIIGSVSTAGRSVSTAFNDEGNPGIMHANKEITPLKNGTDKLTIDSGAYSYDGYYYPHKRRYSSKNGESPTCSHIKDKGVRRYAMKTMYLERVPRKLYRELEHEVLVLQQLDHPNIIRCREVFLYDEKICLILDLCEGGTLRNAKLDEPDVCIVVTQILRALNYLHYTCGIAHRDLKLENIMLESKTRPLRVKLVDFGLSSTFCKGKKLAGSGGTPYTMAPELVLEGEGFTEKTDMWSVGVIIYMLLSKSCPFVRDEKDLGDPKFMDDYSLAKYSLEDPIWNSVSDPAKELIKNLLVRSPKSRWDAHQSLQHCEEIWSKELNIPSRSPFTSEECRFSAVNGNIPVSLFDICCSMRRFSHYSKLKKSALMVAAFTSPNDEIALLREMFLQINSDKTGHIKLEVIYICDLNFFYKHS